MGRTKHEWDIMTVLIELRKDVILFSSENVNRYSRVLWDSFFQFCGCCILGFGIYFLIHNNFRLLLSLTLGNVLVIVGSIIMVVAFLGCMGSIKENKCLLMSVSLLQQLWYPK